MLNHVQGQVWKRVWNFEARSENGCGKWHFLVWNWVWIWRCGQHTLTKNSKEYPPPGVKGWLYCMCYKPACCHFIDFDLNQRCQCISEREQFPFVNSIAVQSGEWWLKEELPVAVGNTMLKDLFSSRYFLGGCYQLLLT